MQSASMPILDISSHSLGLDNIPMKTTNDGDCNTGNYKRSGPTDTPIDELYMFDEIMDEKNQKDLE
jgi:hypothetical protein